MGFTASNASGIVVLCPIHRVCYTAYHKPKAQDKDEDYEQVLDHRRNRLLNNAHTYPVHYECHEPSH